MASSTSRPYQKIDQKRPTYELDSDGKEKKRHEFDVPYTDRQIRCLTQLNRNTIYSRLCKTNKFWHL
jgi:hypothetical protein